MTSYWSELLDRFIIIIIIIIILYLLTYLEVSRHSSACLNESSN
jgi:hypothetical protein